MEFYSKTCAFIILEVFLPDSLVDLFKSLIIMKGNFPGVVGYKDSTVSMTGDSCDMHSFEIPLQTVMLGRVTEV